MAVIIPVVFTAEFGALDHAARDGAMIVVLAVFWLLSRWLNRRIALPGDVSPDFDVEPADRLVTLDLWDSRLGTLALPKDLRARPPA